MISEDVIKQLVGETTGWDEVDTMSFQLEGCSKFDGATAVVSFESGIVEVYDEAGAVEKQFAIKATLEEITPKTV